MTFFKQNLVICNFRSFIALIQIVSWLRISHSFEIYVNFLATTLYEIDKDSLLPKTVDIFESLKNEIYLSALKLTRSMWVEFFEKFVFFLPNQIF